VAQAKISAKGGEEEFEGRRRVREDAIAIVVGGNGEAWRWLIHLGDSVAECARRMGDVLQPPNEAAENFP